MGNGPDGNAIRSGPGQCLSARDITTQFPGYDVSALPVDGPWYTAGHEDNAAAGKRAERVAVWLRSVELQEQVGDQVWHNNLQQLGQNII